MNHIGELAGLATAVLWALTSIFFGEAGKLIGSFFVNKIRLLFAVIIYSVVLLITTGQIIPVINMEQTFWLGLSGIIGLVIGDSFGFKAIVMIGPRLATLVYSSTPIMTILIAWGMLSEKLGFWEIFGIVITISGISWVVLERKNRENRNLLYDNHPDKGSLKRGIVYGLIAAFCQAAGLVLAKKGMFDAGGVLEPMEASFIRILFSVIIIWLISAVRGQLPNLLRSMKNYKALGFSAAGAVVGPFLGVWMSLVAVKYISTGVAATLNSMTPVMIIPLVILYYKEKVSLRALIGAIIAVVGVSILFLA